jgi:O-antigen/teichoic acid export membrane protein
MRILQVPLFLIIKPISNVFLAKAADNYKNQLALLPLVRKTIFSTFLVAMPLFLVFFLLGPFIFTFLFGAAWKYAGVICSILSFWMVIDLVRVPISQIPVILGRQKEMLGWTSFGTLVTVLSVAYSGLYFAKDIRTAFAIITLAQSCYAIIIIFVTCKQAVIHDRTLA